MAQSYCTPMPFSQNGLPENTAAGGGNYCLFQLPGSSTHLISNKLQSLGHTASVGLFLKQRPIATTNQIHALVDYIHFHGVANMLTDFSILDIFYTLSIGSIIYPICYNVLSLLLMSVLRMNWDMFYPCLLQQNCL